eukprot:scaffold3372_cov54-Phaeocystis_antarctica.AAC.2
MGLQPPAPKVAQWAPGTGRPAALIAPANALPPPGPRRARARGASTPAASTARSSSEARHEPPPPSPLPLSTLPPSPPPLHPCPSSKGPSTWQCSTRAPVIMSNIVGAVTVYSMLIPSHDVAARHTRASSRAASTRRRRLAAARVASAAAPTAAPGVTASSAAGAAAGAATGDGAGDTAVAIAGVAVGEAAGEAGSSALGPTLLSSTCEEHSGRAAAEEASCLRGCSRRGVAPRGDGDRRGRMPRSSISSCQLVFRCPSSDLPLPRSSVSSCQLVLRCAISSCARSWPEIVARSSGRVTGVEAEAEAGEKSPRTG